MALRRNPSLPEFQVENFPNLTAATAILAALKRPVTVKPEPLKMLNAKNGKQNEKSTGTVSAHKAMPAVTQGVEYSTVVKRHCPEKTSKMERVEAKQITQRKKKTHIAIPLTLNLPKMSSSTTVLTKTQTDKQVTLLPTMEASTEAIPKQEGFINPEAVAEPSWEKVTKKSEKIK